MLVGTELLPRLLRNGALDTAPLSEALPPFPSTRDALVGCGVILPYSAGSYPRL